MKSGLHRACPHQIQGFFSSFDRTYFNLLTARRVNSALEAVAGPIVDTSRPVTGSTAETFTEFPCCINSTKYSPDGLSDIRQQLYVSRACLTLSGCFGIFMNIQHIPDLGQRANQMIHHAIIMQRAWRKAQTLRATWNRWIINWLDINTKFFQ